VSDDGDSLKLRHGPLFRTLFEVLRDSPSPLAPKDAITAVETRIPLNPRELSRNDSGVRRFETHLRFTTSRAIKLGWMTKDGGWALTDAGRSALVAHGDQLAVERDRQYRQLDPSGGYTDARWATVAAAVAMVEAGSWTTYGDLSTLTGLSAQSIGAFLASQPVANAHRVLRVDGRVAADFRWADPERADDPRAVLETEGLAFDGDRRADAAQRMTAETLREALGEESGSELTRRAWLVRGSSVDGRDLVAVWLQKGTTSLAASKLRALLAPVDTATLAAAVEEDYSYASYAARRSRVAEFEAFFNRMRVGDHVLTTSNGHVYVGEVTGPPEFVASSDNRSNLRRTVQWHNPTNGVVFSKLPAPFSVKISSQDDVVDLSGDTAVIDALLASLGVADDIEPPVRDLEFPVVTEELATELLTDRGWLQDQADLLWDRKQMIFYGPPGTGKTYIARALAAHLAGDASRVSLVQFHPSYTYEDFFEGFRPVSRGDGVLAFELRPGPFRRLVETAREHPSDPYVLIVDEINRANLAAVFGELYFLLEYRDERIELLYSDEKFTLPPNVFLIGTMNTADRSIAFLDAAMRRRFAFVELHPAEPPTVGLLAAWIQAQGSAIATNLDAPALLDALNSRIAERDLAIGPSYLMRPSVYRSAAALDRVWDSSILPLLAEHHYGSGPEALDPYRLDTLRAAITNS
jgi:5-methylcytosine-specific restriction protein B